MPVDIDDPLPPEDWSPIVCPPASIDMDDLYRAQQRRLLGLFSRKGFAEDGADLLNEAFRRLITAARRLGGAVESPEAYLHRIAQNLAREHARSRLNGFVYDLDNVEVAGPDPFIALEARDTLERVDHILSALKPRTREIFLMHRLDGLSYAEIAVAMGISVKGVEKQMAKALFALRRRTHRR